VKKKEGVQFHVELSGVQKATIGAAVVLVLVIAVVTGSSDQVRLPVLGLFAQLLGSILLGLGLIKTNDELLDLAEHHERFEKQRLVSHLTKDRFFIVFGVFLVVTGLLLQILGTQLGY
jgi:hypothetical protein